MYFIYILESQINSSFYVGYTQDFEQRLKQHNFTSLDSYTCKFRPWKMKAILPVGSDESLAISIERYIKRQKQRRFIKLVIDKANDDDFLKWLVDKCSAG